MNKILKDTKKLTFIGVMFGLTLFFTFTLGVIPASFASLAILIFIPTIITSIIHGPLAGGIMGFLAGASTLLRAMVAPAGILDPFFINPLISILPRIFVGIIPYYVYTFLKKNLKQWIYKFLLIRSDGGDHKHSSCYVYALYIKSKRDCRGSRNEFQSIFNSDHYRLRNSWGSSHSDIYVCYNICI